MHLETPSEIVHIVQSDRYYYSAIRMINRMAMQMTTQDASSSLTPFDAQLVLYQDDDIICINKQAGELVVADRWKKETNVLLHKLGVYLRAQGHQPDATGRDLYPVHRLDRDTSGVVVFAKNAEAHRNLSKQFESRDVAKKYWLFTRGAPEWDEHIVDAPLRRLEGKRGRGRGTVDWENGKPARTQFRVLNRYHDVGWLEAEPETGRLHQIRLHAMEAGFPLLYDPQYLKAPWESEFYGPLPLQRVPLHAHWLRFAHPRNRQRALEISAPLDGALTQLVRVLEDESEVMI